MLIIRKASSSDAEKICKIQQITWRDTYASAEQGVSYSDLAKYTKSWTTPGNINLFAKLIDQSGQRWLVAEEGGEVVGHIRFIKHSDYGEINMMYILPLHQRRGIGKKLLATAIKNFNDEIIVDVINYNIQAIHFYESFGFKFFGKEPNSADPLPSGKRLELIRMKKPAS